LSDLQSPYFFTLEKGRQTQRRLKKGLSVFAAGILDTIAAGLQVAQIPEGSSTWSAEEYDTLGKYLAEYRAGSGPDVVIRRKLKYQSTLVGGQRGLRIQLSQKKQRRASIASYPTFTRMILPTTTV